MVGLNTRGILRCPGKCTLLGTLVGRESPFLRSEKKKKKKKKKKNEEEMYQYRDKIDFCFNSTPPYG
jgi:hypothetical protein